MDSQPLSSIVSGNVMHHRLGPIVNRFIYPVFFVVLKLDELDRLNSRWFGVNRFAPLAFHFKDYGDGSDPKVWVRDLLQKNGLKECADAIWLQTFPRVFGYLFNPVSFWYCMRKDGSLGAIIAEVNNTFGDRCCYLLRPDGQGKFHDVAADKVMYVSPFYPVEGHYRFHFDVDNFERPTVRINYFQQDRLQLKTSIWGEPKPLVSRNMMTALLRQPFLTLGVTFRIHWQALRLWWKGAVFHKHQPTSLEKTTK